MLSAPELFRLIIMVITWISEILLCGSIIIVFTIEWKKKQQFGVSDKILLYTAITNLLLQSFTVLDDLVYLLCFNQIMSLPGSILMFTFTHFFLYDNIWHTAWLSIHYCLKLVAPSLGVFSQMKKWLSAFIFPLLIGTSVGMFFINLPYVWTARMEFFTNMTNIDSNKVFIIHQEIPFTTCNIILGCCLPFLVTLICIGLSVDALVRHMWRMRRSASQFSSSPQLQGHVRATRTMILQLLLNLLLYLSIIGIFLLSRSSVIWVTIVWSSILLNPPAQTLTLILGNPKLKNKLFGRQLNDRIIEMKLSEL